jgi:hypothetical protein
LTARIPLAEGNSVPNCIHILKDAHPECGGICQIIANIARYAGSSGYQNTVLFLGDGPSRMRPSSIFTTGPNGVLASPAGSTPASMVGS